MKSVDITFHTRGALQALRVYEPSGKNAIHSGEAPSAVFVLRKQKRVENNQETEYDGRRKYVAVMKLLVHHFRRCC